MLMKKFAVLSLLILLFSCGAARAVDICTAPVTTATGQVQGLAEKATPTCVWRGLPYAAPPVGDLRFRAPQPAAKWEGVREMSRWGARCMQTGIMELVNADPSGRMSEDCLFLNVWRPSKPGTFPVMVWIHGGGYVGGTGNTEGYWGDRLAAAGDVVVVTINYRLDQFGFFALPALREEDPHRSTGSYGSLDQVAALKWVHDNIAGFGGDPANVTIFGESAGGDSICTMVATPLAAGLFQRAIMQSGGCEGSLPVEWDSRDLARKLGCDPSDLKCLRALPAKTILKKAAGGMLNGTTAPHVDGYLLTGTPLSMIQAGNYNKVPFMIGTTRDEIGLLVYLLPELNKAKPAEYAERLQKKFSLTEAEAARAVSLYPLAEFNNEPRRAYMRMLTDAAVICVNYYELLALSAQQQDLYFYRFDYDKMFFGKTIGSAHSMEIPFIFDSLDRAPNSALYDRKRIAATAALRKTVQSYWLNFAKTGNPNGGSLPSWPQFTAASPLVQLLDLETRTIPFPIQARCAFWQDYNQTHPSVWGILSTPEE